MVRHEAATLVLQCLVEVMGDDDPSAAAGLDESTVLVGSNAVLDSIKLVELIADVEQRLERDYGLHVQLADERALSMEESPLRSVPALAEYICLLAVEQQSHV